MYTCWAVHTGQLGKGLGAVRRKQSRKPLDRRLVTPLHCTVFRCILICEIMLGMFCVFLNIHQYVWHYGSYKAAKSISRDTFVFAVLPDIGNSAIKLQLWCQCHILNKLQQGGLMCVIGNPRQQRISSIAKTPNIPCFVAIYSVFGGIIVSF